MPRAAAASIAAIPNPPLCDAKPTLPDGGAAGATVALSATSGRGFATPRQSGPTIRMPASRQTASSSPAAATAVSTTRTLAPFAPHARAASTTASAGTAMTASSTAPSTPASAPLSGTTCSAPAKPPARRLRTTSPPGVPGAPDPPITATEAGRRTCATAATSAVRWRSSKRSRAARDSDVGNSSSTSPSDRCATTGKPESWKTPSIRRFSDSTFALNVSIPSSAAACARWASSTVAIPWPCQASATANATSARPGAARTYVPCPTTVPSAPRSASSDRPAPGTAARRAASSRSTPALKKRNQRERSESESRNARNRGTSSATVGRTRTVEPSGRTMSVSITSAIARDRRNSVHGSAGLDLDYGSGGNY